MRLPAVAIAALFACGAVLGQAPWLSERVSSHAYLAIGFASVGFLVCAGIFFAIIGRLFPAAAISSLSWLILGVLGAGIANQPRPADHVLSLLEAGRMELKTPLRWHGRLRDEPARLPSCGRQCRRHDANKRPQVYSDDGAFDRRAYLEQQNIDLVATLRARELMEHTAISRATAATLLARARRRLREEVDTLFGSRPQVDGVLRAMLLGDRSFVERSESTDFQKTGVFHVLVVAGLHVGAVAVFLFWIGRAFRLTPFWTAVTTLTLLFAYVAVVEQRPPVLRAALMTAIVVIGGLFFRRLDLLNSAGMAALILLVARPLAVRDSSFQLTFLAIGCLAVISAGEDNPYGHPNPELLERLESAGFADIADGPRRRCTRFNRRKAAGDQLFCRMFGDNGESSISGDATTRPTEAQRAIGRNR
jgi:ComEC/Rec2-related protein